jgi:hypothetical protein
MVRQEYDPRLINCIANRADVRPFIDHRHVDGPLDLSPAVGWATQTGVVWLSNGEDAVAAFEQAGDRVWNAHVLFAGSCRGNRALAVAREMIERMRPYADEIWGLVPLANRAARWFARALGFKADARLDDDGMGACEAFVWRPA